MIFAWPGLGQLAVESITARDYPMVQGLVLLAGAVSIVVNLLVDLSYRLLDPRIRTAAVQFETLGGGTSNAVKMTLAGIVGLLVGALVLLVVALGTKRRNGPPVQGSEREKTAASMS